MANEQHLAILKQGVNVWNRWRREKPDITPDLSAANLVSLNLRKVDFHACNLDQANLSYADLIDANFRNATLTSSRLQSAYLCMADFQAAALNAADLSLANLNYANFASANLAGTLMRATQAVSTDFSHANLTGACIESWNICNGTNFRQATCDYIYLKANWSTQHRKFIYLNRRFSKKRNAAKACAGFPQKGEKSNESVGRSAPHALALG
ncbi:MAG: pentapeptide repeat-containing protein [Leptolyngbyaceae cyanobacterium]